MFTRKPSRALALRLAALSLAASAVGCAAIPVQLHTEMTTMSADGKVEHTEHNWEGTLDQLPGELAKAGNEMGQATAKMVKQLTDVPPPGKIELKDLGPGFERYQGNPDADFLMLAKNEKGEKEEFEYVRLGVPSYDEFFKTAQELHALTWQATQTTARMRQFSSKALNEKVDVGANLRAAVDKASGANAQASAKLTPLVEVGGMLGMVVPEMASKVSQLVSAGEKLVAGAPAALTDPKFVTHLGLVKHGLVASIAVVKESGVAMVGLGKDLSPFKKTAAVPGARGDVFGLVPAAAQNGTFVALAR